MSHPIFNPGSQVNIGLALENGERGTNVQGKVGITKKHRNNRGESSAHISGSYEKEIGEGGGRATKRIGLGVTNISHTPRIQSITNLQINATEKKSLQNKLRETEQYKTIQSLCLQLNTELQGKTKGGLYYQLNTKYELNKTTGSNASHTLTIGGGVKGNFPKSSGMQWFLSGNMILQSDISHATQRSIKTGLQQKLAGDTKASFGIEYNETTKKFKPLINIGLKKVF